MDKIKLLVILGGFLFFILNWLMGGKMMRWYRSLQRTAKWVVSGVAVMVFLVSFFKNPESFSVADMLSTFMDGKMPNIKNMGMMGEVLENSKSGNEVVDEGKKVKRNVNGYTKRLVAHNQDWLCKKCGNKLDPMFETDHITPLYQGGTNDVSNLQALCRNCHGKKTMMDAINGK